MGEETTFTMYLPRSTSLAERDTPTGERLHRGRGRILLVDDESALVRLGQAMLERLGYDVIPTTSSLEALEMFRMSPQEIDLVITDQTMPEMTGEVLTRELRLIRPDIPIILCTGFSHQMDEQKALSLGINEFLMKPLKLSDVSTTVQQILASMRLDVS